MKSLHVFCFVLICLSRSFGASSSLVIDDRGGISAQANNHSSNPLVSRDGSTIVFESLANNLVSPSITNKFIQIYAEPAGTGVLELVSKGNEGSPANANSYVSDISKDGKVILFESTSSSLAGMETNRPIKNLYARLLSTRQTVLVSAGVSGKAQPMDSWNGVLSADGKRVLFESINPGLAGTPLPVSSNYLYLRNLETGVTIPLGTNFYNGSDLSSFVRGGLNLDGSRALFTFSTNGTGFVAIQDLTAGTTVCVWTNTFTNEVTLSNLQLSDDGNYFTFATSDPSTASSQVFFGDLLNNGVTNISGCEYIRQKGEIFGPQLTADGRYLSYSKSDFIPGGNVFAIWDRLSSTEIMKSQGLLGRISNDGTKVSFIPGVVNYNTLYNTTNAVLLQKDLTQIDVTNFITVASDGVSLPLVTTATHRMSDDGTIVVFQSIDGNLVEGDTNHFSDVFSRNINQPTCRLVSRAADPGVINIIRPDVQIIGTVSMSNSVWSVLLEPWTRFVTGTTNNTTQLVLSDVKSGYRILVTTNLSGLPFSGSLYSPGFSSDGRFFVFGNYTRDFETNKTPSLFNELYFLDRSSGEIINVTKPLGPVGSPPSVASSITADGSIIGFVRNQGGIDSNFLYFPQTKTYELFSNSASAGAIPPWISPDGSSILYSSSSPRILWLTNRLSHTATNLGVSLATNVHFSLNSTYVYFGLTDITVVDTSTFTTNFIAFGQNASISSNGLALAFETGVSKVARDTGSQDIYLLNITNQVYELISESWDGTSAGNFDSTHPSISPDGRYVLFTSRATNLVPGVTNIQNKAYLRDRVTRTTSLIAGGLGADPAVGSGPFFDISGNLILYRTKTESGSGSVTDLTAATFYLELIETDFVDTDHDGLDDKWEMLHFGNLTANGQSDTDGDGATDLEEYLAGTDPLDPQSVFKGLPVSRDSQGRVVLSWKAVFGKNYRVQYKTSLSTGQWLALDGGVSVAGEVASFVDTSFSGTGTRFYRVVEMP